MTVAQLGLAVDSSQVSTATPALEKMAAAAGHAEAAATRMTRANAASSDVMQRMLAVLVSMERDLTVVARAAITEEGAMNAATAAVNRNTLAHRSNGMAMANSRNLMFQIVDIGQGLPLLFQNAGYGAINLGNQLAQIGQAYHGQGGFGQAFRDFGGLVRPLAPALLGAATAAGVAVGIFAGLTTKINETAKTQVSFGEVFRATIEVAAGAIGEFFKPALAQLGSWFQQLTDFIAPLFKNAINFVVGFFAQGYDHIVLSWTLLPSAMGDIAIGAANNVLKAIEDMLNKSRAQIVLFLSQMGAAVGPLGGGLLTAGAGVLAGAGDIHLGQIANPYAGTASFIAGKTDYGGQAFDAISQKAQQLALEDAAKKAGKAAKGTSDIVKGPLTDGIDKLTAKTSAWADAATSAFSNLGTGIVNAFTKGGNVAMNVLDMLLGKIGDFGTSLLNSGLNSLLNAAIGGITGAMTPTGGVWGNGLWGSAIFAGVHHNGGVAGFPTMGRTVPASLFDGALRYHGGGIAGLRPDEVPAILQRGERITPANQNGAPSFSISVTVNADSTTNGAAVARQVAQELRRQVPDLIAASQRNPYRRTA